MLRQLMAARLSIAVTSGKIPVIIGLFDPFRSSFIALEHLLRGFARNAMDFFFHALTGRGKGS